MSVNLATPWVPSLNGNTLPPCSLIASVVEEGTKPSYFDMLQRPWSRKALQNDLDKMPTASEVIWECVLSIWRLKLVEEEGAEDAVWVDHVSAWLQTVLDFLDALVVMNIFLEGKVPSMDKPVPKPATPIPSPEPEPEAVAPHRRIRTREESLDIVMVDSTGSDLEVVSSSTKGKGWARSKGTDILKDTISWEVSQDLDALGSKCELPPLSDYSETAATKPEEKKVDLSGYVFDEDSIVDETLVPRVKGQCCQNCTDKRRKRNCRVIWHQNKNVVTVCCAYCLANKQGCNFKDMDLNIVAWPTLRAMQEGLSQRAKEASMKRKGNSGRSEASGSGMKNEPFMLTQESASAITTQSQACGRTTTTTSSQPGVAIQGSASGLPAGLALGCTPSIFLENLLTFQNALSDPNHTSTSLELARIELRGVMRRESGEARWNKNFFELEERCWRALPKEAVMQTEPTTTTTIMKRKRTQKEGSEVGRMETIYKVLTEDEIVYKSWKWKMNERLPGESMTARASMHSFKQLATDYESDDELVLQQPEDTHEVKTSLGNDQKHRREEPEQDAVSSKHPRVDEEIAESSEEETDLEERDWRLALQHSSLAVRRLPDRFVSVYLRNITKYEYALRAPSRSECSVHLAQIELKWALKAEKYKLDNIAKEVEGRCQIGKAILREMDRELESLDRDLDSDSVEEVHCAVRID
ncbi:hypothetical protein BDM02DRAFT_3132849 [Thelephora ganbajun]|uniref:Uncharacterized protein n=1 Tax=Thelephora ganbajun TaxID=370292 RepID=A0ACB6YZD4_THEGA|nr:hypothetical protein BDM02DRAFT_3132849 [Thelephora ganbajun]